MATEDTTAAKAARVCQSVLGHARELASAGAQQNRHFEEARRKVAQRVVNLREHSLLRRTLIYVRIEDEADARAEERMREKHPGVPRWQVAPEAAERAMRVERLTLLSRLGNDEQRRYWKMAKDKHVESYATAARDLAEAEHTLRGSVAGGGEALEKAVERRKRGFWHRLLH